MRQGIGVFGIAVALSLSFSARAYAEPEGARADYVLAQDLAPEQGILDVIAIEGRVLLDVRTRLLEEHPYRYCQMVTTGGSVVSPDIVAVYIVRQGEKATAFAKRLVEPTPTDKDGRAKSKSAPISTRSADLLEQVWEMMLDRVQLPPRDLTLWNDAPSYYFHTCCSERSGLVGGAFVRASKRPTRPERLARIGDALIDYVEGKPEDRADGEKSLDRLAQELLDELVRLGGTPPDPKLRRSRQPAILPPPDRRKVQTIKGGG